MAASHGFVYVLGNDFMPEVFKIGYTDNHPRVRLDQLSGATACPVPFTLLAYFGTFRARDVEQEIHEELRRYRINSAREFFHVSPATVYMTIARFVELDEEAFFNAPLLEIVREHNKSAAARWPVDYFHSQCADPIHWPEPMQFDPDEVPF